MNSPTPWGVGKERRCPICGDPFITRRTRRSGRRKYCSAKCRRVARRRRWAGESNPAWRGGGQDRGDRRSPEYRAWRRAVLERDGRRCQGCGTNRKLHAHHILGWAQYPNHRYDVDNGLTVCSSCHDEIHGRTKRQAGRAA